MHILESEHLKYLTKVFELALREVESRLTEEKGFLSVEYELYPFDSERIVITASNRKIGEDVEEGEMRIPVVDPKTYSLSIENLRIEGESKLTGDAYCFMWNGPLVGVATEVYRVKVTPVIENKTFNVTLSLSNVNKDANIIANEISEILDNCF